MKLKGNQGILAMMLVVGACMASAARGDLVFSPPSATVPVGQSVEANAALALASPIDLLQMDVFLNSTTGTIGFEYAQAFMDATAPGLPFSPDFPDQGVTNIGGDFGLGAGGSGSFPVGIFTIQTAGMQPGFYSLGVDSGSPGGFLVSFTRRAGEADLPLSGIPFTFEVTSSVVPAPGAFLLGAVGLGFVGWFRRRTA